MIINKEYSNDWKIFPCIYKGKTPLVKKGFKDATNDLEKIKEWEKIFSKKNWGLSAGASDLAIIDIDPKHGGYFIEDDDNFIIGAEGKEFKLPKTLLVKTGSGGNHLYYKGAIKSRKLVGSAIEIKSIGGYVIIPPSIHQSGNRYEWVNDLPIADFPEYILPIEQEPKKREKSTSTENEQVEYDKVLFAIQQLKKERTEDYENWIQLGMILHSLGQDELYFPVWDMWSRQSSKYVHGECAKKWNTFTDTDNGLTIGTLYHWAEEDSNGVFVRPASKNSRPSDYLQALNSMGYTFSMNRMNDTVFVNGQKMSDGLEALILTRLREYDYKGTATAKDLIRAEAYKNQFHPIEEYLINLKWDGQDHIGKLASYIKDKDGIFPLIFRKWLVGAVYKILGTRKGEQNPMLVLDGKQGIGKSRLSWWLCSGIPQFFISSPIYPDNKDYIISTVSRFIWEVEELGSTFRKADREALKAFITREEATYRAPYGHHEITKPTTCSYIGTINDEVGFLTDPTGNRRFRVCTLTSIDWKYSEELDVNQVWAQAVHLFESGETSRLSKDEEKLVTEISSNYENEDPLTSFILENYIIEPENEDYFYPTSKIIQDMSVKSYHTKDNDFNLNRRIGAILIKMGCQQKRKRINGGQYKGWVGIKPLHVISDDF